MARQKASARGKPADVVVSVAPKHAPRVRAMLAQDVYKADIESDQGSENLYVAAELPHVSASAIRPHLTVQGNDGYDGQDHGELTLQVQWRRISFRGGGRLLVLVPETEGDLAAAAHLAEIGPDDRKTARLVRVPSLNQHWEPYFDREGFEAELDEMDQRFHRCMETCERTQASHYMDFQVLPGDPDCALLLRSTRLDEMKSRTKIAMHPETLKFRVRALYAWVDALSRGPQLERQLGPAGVGDRPSRVFGPSRVFVVSTKKGDRMDTRDALRALYDKFDMARKLNLHGHGGENENSQDPLAVALRRFRYNFLGIVGDIICGEGEDRETTFCALSPVMSDQQGNPEYKGQLTAPPKQVQQLFCSRHPFISTCAVFQL